MIWRQPKSLPIRIAPNGSPNSPVLPLKPLAGHRIGVIDYGMGNQQSLINALEKLGLQLSAEPDTLQECALITLPG